MSSDTDAVRAALTDRMGALAAHLRGTDPATRTRTELRFGRSESLVVVDDGPKRGSWHDHESGDGGGPIDLIMHERGDAFTDALRFARSFLGDAPPAATSRVDHTPPQRTETSDDEARCLRKVRELAGRPTRAADALPARRYLVHRGLDPNRIPDAVRYTSDDRDLRGDAAGALIFPATDEAGDVVATQRIFITAGGNKAHVPDLPNAKQTDGIARGAAVRISGGGRRGVVVVAEGPETGLSVAQATCADVWIALGGVARTAKSIPHGLHVVLAADHDADGSPARRKADAAAEDIRERGDTCDVVRPPNPGDDWNDVARRHGRRQVARGFVDALHRDPTPPSVHAALPLQHARRELDAAVRGAAGANAGHATLIRTTPGTGKTRAALRATIEHVRANTGAQAVILAPEHALTGEIEAALRDVAGADDVDILRWLGAEKHCDNRELLDAVRNNGGSTSNACDACPLHDACGFPAQKQRDPDILIGAHALLRTGLPTVIAPERLSLVVVDESPTSALLHGTDAPDKITLDELTAERDRDSMGADNADECEAVGALVADAVRATERWLDRDALPGNLTARRLRDAAKAEWRAVPDEPAATADAIATAERLQEFGRIKGEAQARSRVFRILAAWLEWHEPRCPFAERARERTADGGTCDALAVRFAHRFGRRWNKADPTWALLDATADDRILRAWWPHLDVRDIHAALPDHVRVRHVHGMSTTARALTGMTGSAQDRRQAPAKRARLARLAEASGAALIAQKAVVDRIHAAHPGALDGGARHFGRTRGTNELEAVGHLIVAGRPLPNAATCARTASAIRGRWIDPEQAYERRTRTAWGRDGRPVANANGVAHPDADAEAVRASIADAEVVQAAHRARPVNRAHDEPLTIDVVAPDVAPSIPFTGAVDVDALPQGPTDLAAARGVVPDTDAALAAVVADHWSTANALKQNRKNAAATEPVSTPHGTPYGELTPVHTANGNAAALYVRWRIHAPAISRKRFTVRTRRDFARADIEAVLNADVHEAVVIEGAPALPDQPPAADEFDDLDEDERRAAARHGIRRTRVDTVATRRADDVVAPAAAAAAGGGAPP